MSPGTDTYKISLSMMFDTVNTVTSGVVVSVNMSTGGVSSGIIG